MTTAPATPPVEDVRRDVRLVGILLLSLIVVAYLPLPFKLAGIAFGLVTVVVAIRALVRLGRLRRAGGRPRGQIALAAAMGLAGFVTLLLVSEAVIYPVAVDRDACFAGAVTQVARDGCQEEYEDQLEDFLGPWYERIGDR